MQKHQIEMGDVELALHSDQRVVVSRSHPRAEDCTTNNSGESTRDYCAADVKFGLMGWRMQPSPDAEGQADRSAKTKDVRDEMGEAIARVSEHCDGRGSEEEAWGTVGHNAPRKQ